MVSHWLSMALLLASSGQTTDIAAIEKGLFDDANGPRWTIQERMKHHKVPGVNIAVVRDKKLAWAKGYGLTEVASQFGVTVETLLQAASMSKPIAALIALILADQGQIDIDEDVNKYLKRWKVPASEFTKDRRVTVRDLVSHQAGVNVHGFLGYPDGRSFPTLLQVIQGEKPANSAALKIERKPGEEFRYSGGGYCILQLLIDDVTGKDFAALAREMVFEPLGMKRSHYHIIQNPDSKSYAAGHDGKGAVIPGKRRLHPESAAASLWTTPSEYAQFGIMLMNQGKAGKHQVLATKLVREMLSKQAPARDGAIGLGVMLNKDGSFGHGGSNIGFRCNSLFMPESGSGVIIMTNGDNGSQLADEILRSVRAHYGI